MVDRSLTTPEVRSSNPVIRIFYSFSTELKRRIKEKRGREWAIFNNSFKFRASSSSTKLRSGFQRTFGSPGNLRHFVAFDVSLRYLSVWPELAKFRHLGKILRALGVFVIVYLAISKFECLLWQLRILSGNFSIFQMAKY